jgi:hypothetical protein
LICEDCARAADEEKMHRCTDVGCTCQHREDSVLKKARRESEKLLKDLS